MIQILDEADVMLTMVFGAFIAGSSPEGSAAIAYPVFTLYLDIMPENARNFAFAIQSIGMTAASLFILGRRIPVDWYYIRYITIGGLLGLLAGTFWLVPIVPPVLAKLIFVSLWLSFGIVLYFRNAKGGSPRLRLPKLTKTDLYWLYSFGFLGGCISALFGTGINMLSFCFVVLYFGLSEKVATPSSIIIMSIETIAGFLLHSLILNDMSDESWNMWLACIPVVIFMAPLGSWFASKLNRMYFQRFLYTIFFIQYMGAILVIKPGFFYALLSFAIILTGILLFRWVSTHTPIRENN